ncbi:MAG: hypothetical protein CVV44_21135 [Spirochaetae bacterium HGW-Spirochaetae-1]|jgi:hypothetical protein|nr:MAG: hypothetical protein CVV44_21135 [Spirochaetae bacterium HGW-Spirochaetae-1]
MKHIIKSGIKKLLKNHAIIFISLLMMAFSGCEMSSSDSATDDQVRQVAEQADSIALDMNSLADLFSQLQTIDEESGTGVNAEDITKILGDITTQYGDLQTKLSDFKALLQGLPGDTDTDSLSALAAIFEMYSDLSDGELKEVSGVDSYVQMLTNLAAQFQDIEGTEELGAFLAALPGLNTELMNNILPIALNDLAAMIIDAFNTMAQLLGYDDVTVTYDGTSKVLFTNLDLQPVITALNNLRSQAAPSSPARAAGDPIFTADELAPYIGFITGLLGSGALDDTDTGIDTTDPSAIADMILGYISGVNIQIGREQLVIFIDFLIPILGEVNPQQADPETAGTELSINSELVYNISKTVNAFADLYETIVIFGYDIFEIEYSLQLNVVISTLFGMDNSADLLRSAALQIDEIALAIAQTETTE